jgi:hypothetical protein
MGRRWRQLQDVMAFKSNPTMYVRMHEAEAEVRRLRGALEEIADNTPQAAVTNANHNVRIARAHLDQEGGRKCPTCKGRSFYMNYHLAGPDQTQTCTDPWHLDQEGEGKHYPTRNTAGTPDFEDREGEDRRHEDHLRMAEEFHDQEGEE